MTLKNNRAPFLSIIKLYASFHHHMWIQTGVTVRKRLSSVVTSVTLTFDLWPWPFAWTSLWSLVITPKNFMMIRWWEHSQKGVTDRQTDGRTDGRTDWTIHRAAWSQLKTEYGVYDSTLVPSVSLVFQIPRMLSIGFTNILIRDSRSASWFFWSNFSNYLIVRVISTRFALIGVQMINHGRCDYMSLMIYMPVIFTPYSQHFQIHCLL